MAVCDVCFRKCEISEGRTGFCMARRCEGGRIVPGNYGKITSLALDPIEKKPLSRFMPGSMIVSVGSYGCNLRCPFCQNNSISYGFRSSERLAVREISPTELVDIAIDQKKNGSTGIAFTYNEPLTGWEFVRDTAKLSREEGLKNVLVSNGTAGIRVLDEILPYIDAMNIDLKAFTDTFYSDLIGGDREMVMDFIRHAAGRTHLEITYLVIPGENDNIKEILALAEYLHSLELLKNCEIALHVTRFFPTFHMTDRPPTPVSTVFALAEAARQKLRYVYEGNV